MGRTTSYSISDLINNQSMQFNKKLDAQCVMLGVYIRFLSRRRAG